MSYIEGHIVIEKAVRPEGTEELLALAPPGQRHIVFDLGDTLQQNGLLAFIKECEGNSEALPFSKGGMLLVPESMLNRFSFYREFYGLSESMLAEIAILKAKEEDNKGSGSSEEDGSSVKKFEQKLKEGKKKKMTSRKLEVRALNVVPAGIAYVMENPNAKTDTPKSLTPANLSSRLGAQCVSLNAFALGKPAAGLKSIGRISGPSLKR